MLARECAPENAGVAGYAEAFRCVLSGKQASIQSRYLRTAMVTESAAHFRKNGPLTPSPRTILTGHLSNDRIGQI